MFTGYYFLDHTANDQRILENMLTEILIEVDSWRREILLEASFAGSMFSHLLFGFLYERDFSSALVLSALFLSI